MINTILQNRYQILNELGRGGMAVVYKALDIKLQREVAVKILHPHLKSKPESALRFMHEAQAVAKLHHKNIIEIFDTSQDKNTLSNFIVTELLAGPTLREFYEINEIKVPELGVAICISLCEALEHAHANGIIHRDLKPENVMFDKNALIKLMDFGIARILDSERVTASGSLIGSPAHMPPEIIEGQSYTATCDIFSLGTVLYYLTTNKLPFDAPSPMAVFKKILDSDFIPADIVNPAISQELSAIITKTLASSPEDRFQTAFELRQKLTAILLKANIDNHEAFIRHFYNTPIAAQKSFISAIIASSLEKSQNLIQNNNLPAALNLINTVLTYDPNNTEAPLILSEIQSNQKRKTKLKLISILLLLLASTCLIASILYVHKENSTQNTNNTLTLTLTPLTPKPTNNTELTINQFQQLNKIIKPYILPPIQTTVKKALTPLLISENNTKENIDNTEKTPEITDKSPIIQIHNNIRDDKKKTANNSNTKTSAQPSNNTQNKNTAHNTTKTSKTDTRKSQPIPPPTTIPTINPQEDPEIITPTQPDTTLIVPIHPPDAYAIYNNRKFSADNEGIIKIPLKPGEHKYTLTCKTRCISKVRTISVPETPTPNNKIELTPTSLEWADATLFIVPPKNIESYFIARRLDLRISKLIHLLPHSPNAISGFNAFGKDISLEVYAIPKNTVTTGYSVNELEQVKIASTRISISPGENKTLNFK